MELLFPVNLIKRLLVGLKKVLQFAYFSPKPFFLHSSVGLKWFIFANIQKHFIFAFYIIFLPCSKTKSYTSKLDYTGSPRLLMMVYKSYIIIKNNYFVFKKPIVMIFSIFAGFQSQGATVYRVQELFRMSWRQGSLLWMVFIRK